MSSQSPLSVHEVLVHDSCIGFDLTQCACAHDMSNRLIHVGYLGLRRLSLTLWNSSSRSSSIIVLGAVHKVGPTSRSREGSPRRCDSLWQREGVKSMWRHAYTNFYHTYETWNLKWCLTFCCNRCRPIVTERERTKNRTKPPRTKTSANNWDRICTEDFSPGFLY